MFRYGALRWFGLDGYRITVSATIEPTPRNPPFHALATILAKIGCMTMGPGGLGPLLFAAREACTLRLIRASVVRQLEKGWSGENLRLQIAHFRKDAIFDHSCEHKPK